MALPLDYLSGRAGYNHWHAGHKAFPFTAMLDKYEWLNWTMLWPFFDLPGLPADPMPGSEDLLDLWVDRTQEANERGWLVSWSLFNRHAKFVSDPDYWQTMTGTPNTQQLRWVERCCRRTEDLDVLLVACVEPRAEQFSWLEAIASHVRRHTNKPIVHNDGHRWEVYPRGYDLYDYGAERGWGKSHYIHSDHEPELGYQRPATQAKWIREQPHDRGILIISWMDLEGDEWPLYGWGSSPIRWDNDEVLDALLERTGQPSVPDPVQDPRTRRIRDRLGWRWDQGLGGAYPRGEYARNLRHQISEARLLVSAGLASPREKEWLKEQE